MKILHLTLKKVHFDNIQNGIKTNEFRLNKPYWRSRLLDKRTESGFKEFDEIHFKNGYSKDAPFMRVEHISTMWADGDMTPLNVDEYVFNLKLGEILERRNIK